ncbi:HugZ family protein [Paludisphaera mucosa]|uniref:Pyridoxamine 5'-phosphate oxidase family protein n=1 Tax=Paludisphaera mucosa TaxID=3030827 RepID=A0ABT6F520_9BACT|nr:pyridoxamine 5'-phosphate oxidase family protein [Paludisphaera mucosa]MDG3002649.1 pyridoxamine 5'-phosphate oxidase family protein [Paludisphaera mucosa]
MEMEAQVGQSLIRLARDQRVASLGTILDGHPLVSLVPFNANNDLSAFDIHVSRLAQHARALTQSLKVGLLIAAADSHARNPQALARLSIRGFAEPLDTNTPAFEEARESYLRKFPQSEISFQLGDFYFIRIKPVAARLVVGFGNIHDLTGDDISSLARQTHGFN